MTGSGCCLKPGFSLPPGNECRSLLTSRRSCGAARFGLSANRGGDHRGRRENRLPTAEYAPPPVTPAGRIWPTMVGPVVPSILPSTAGFPVPAAARRHRDRTGSRARILRGRTSRPPSYPAEICDRNADADAARAVAVRHVRRRRGRRRRHARTTRGRSRPTRWRGAHSLLALLRDAEEHLASARSRCAAKSGSRSSPTSSRSTAGSPTAWARLHRSAPRRTRSRAGRVATARCRSCDRDPASRRRSATTSTKPRSRTGRRRGPGLVGAGTGRRVGGGRNAPPARADELAEMLAAAGAPPAGWTRHGAVPLPGRRARRRRRRFPSAKCWAGWSRPAPARSTASARACAGWAGSRSGRWSSPHAARWFRSCASARGAAARARDSNGSYSVRWTPALVDPARLARSDRDDARDRCSRSTRTSTRAR